MPFDTTTPDLDLRISFAVDLARRVGRDASDFRRDSGAAALQVENKGLQDFVTIADKRAEETIQAAMRTHFPEDGFIGEETGGQQQTSGVWVVDPIDGTTNFMRGFRHWGVSMAYVVGEQVMAGVIYDAAQDAVYSAIRGKGAYKDGRPIKASPVTDPKKAIAIMGHSRRTSFDDYIEILKTLYDKGIDYRRMGAAAIGLVRVADGIADLYYERQLNSWDMLAGALIAHEAGAIVRMPLMQECLSKGGPVYAAAPGLDSEFTFMADPHRAQLQPI